MKQMHTISGTVQRAKLEGFPISEYTLRRWVRSGQIPSIRAGQKYLIFWPNLLSFLCGGTTNSSPDNLERVGIRRVDEEAVL